LPARAKSSRSNEPFSKTSIKYQSKEDATTPTTPTVKTADRDRIQSQLFKPGRFILQNP
jgi:hypothetical protein